MNNKTWVFDNETLKISLEKWVKKQIETGHPKAQANARFVSECILDFLENDEKLVTHKTISEERPKSIPSTGKSNSSAEIKVEDKDEGTSKSNLSVDEMLSSWEEMR